MSPHSAPANDRVVSRVSSRRFRFGVLDIMLVTFVIATWSPTFVAIRDIPRLSDEVEQMRALTEQLPILDESKLCIRRLPSIWHNIQSWKYYLPEHAQSELRFATEQINAFGDPKEFQAAELPTGIHTIHLKYETSPENEFVSQVFVDHQLAITKTHPAEWRESGGSTWSGSVAPKTETHLISDRLELMRMRLSIDTGPGRGSATLPDEYDAKGNLLWIAPRDTTSSPAPDFVSPALEFYRWNRSWGHRQGAKIVTRPLNSQPGTIGLHPDQRLVLDDRLRHSTAMNELSIRPVTEAYPGGEFPEQSSQPGAATGEQVKYQIHDSLTVNEDDLSRDEAPAAGVISVDRRFMRIYVHYDAFPSGAKPIVEVIFDAQYPHRIGLLPHQARGSTPIRAVQFVSQRDSLVRLRQMALIASSERSETEVASDAFRTSRKISSVPLSTACPPDSKTEWVSIDWDRMPVSTEAGRAHHALQLTTNDPNLSQTPYPPALLNTQWVYRGLPIRLSWHLPTTLAKTSGARLEIRATDVYPGTQLAVPGGAVVRNVRITVPLPAAEPVWFAVESDETSSAGDAQPSESEKSRE